MKSCEMVQRCDTDKYEKLDKSHHVETETKLYFTTSYKSNRLSPFQFERRHLVDSSSRVQCGLVKGQDRA